MIIDRDITTQMSDGVCLRADLYRPHKEGRYPCIVERIPYLKETERFVSRAEYFADQGYAYIIQDVRGRGKSDGVFYPFFTEARDGYETLTWITNQHWANGKIGTIGASYAAWTQWLCAQLQHPSLVTMIVESSPPDFFQQLPYQKGAFSLPMLSWLVELDGHDNQNIGTIDWQRIWKTRPLSAMDTLCGRELRAWQDWLDHDCEDSYWRKIAFNRAMHRIRLPVFHVSGWYDDSLLGSLINYRSMCSGEPSRTGRYFQKLLIGPWPHRPNTTSKFGPVDFGQEGIIDLLQIERKWFDHWLKNSTHSTLLDEPVQFFEMGAQRWHRSPGWPPMEARQVPLYLHSNGAANTKKGDGKLDFKPATSEPTDEYYYDPADPVPFVMDPDWRQLGGPDDYSQIEERQDILVYSTEPLEKDIRTAGPISLILYARSSAKDTDFTAKLLDAQPNGSAIRINDGIIRARFRASRTTPSLIIPGSIYRYAIDCWASSYVFRKGHKIRLEISSSAFPKFDPNLNTGSRIKDDVQGKIAHQVIFHTRAYPSHVLLTILPSEAG